MFEFVKAVFNRKERKAIDRLRKYQTVYNTPEGKWVMNDILALCKYGESALGGSDRETNFRLGEQNIGIEIVQLLTADIAKLEEQSKKEEVANEREV